MYADNYQLIRLNVSLKSVLKYVTVMSCNILTGNMASLYKWIFFSKMTFNKIKINQSVVVNYDGGPCSSGRSAWSIGDPRTVPETLGPVRDRPGIPCSKTGLEIKTTHSYGGCCVIPEK